MTGDAELMATTERVGLPATLLVAISPAEVSLLIAAPADRSHQMAVSAVYGPRLRASGVAR
ncbi:hypothetical protein [Thiomonas sp. FB-Cd]|uniref:hypothetical protein n=1 Tax=Thiomonas sp. FB-Cd TaxID=1158292 RepID=UPI0004DF55EE|nr:hypothetical protein [Thiomonas sp. FB-Cd]